MRGLVGECADAASDDADESVDAEREEPPNQRANSTEADKCGYIEDRRPASNMDPYVVTDALVRPRNEVTA